MQTAAFTDGQVRGGWELTDRALDPYTYARAAAQAARGGASQNMPGGMILQRNVVDQPSVTTDAGSGRGHVTFAIGAISQGISSEIAGT